MARKHDKQKALAMRHKGMSYSQIKEKLGISKSTLSIWLHDFPLSEKRIRELRADNEKRIERFRITMAKKRQTRLDSVYSLVSKRLEDFSERELFISGLFLYWAEGSKASRNTVQITNTDPVMIRFFMKWLDLFDVSKSRLRIYLLLYAVMVIEKETIFWSRTLG